MKPETLEHRFSSDRSSSDLEKPHSEPPPIDRGLQAWLQVFGSWILFMWTWGLANSFGVFQTYYVQTLLTESSPSTIAWIGSIQVFLTLGVAIFAGWLIDAGYLRTLLISGTLLEVFGMMMTSISTEYYQILLAQGICTGLGSGLLGVTSVAVIPFWFQKHRMIATGIAATGSSVAGVIFPIMLQRLFENPKIGFAWGVRIFAFMMLGTLSIAIAVMKLRVMPTSRRGWPSPSLLKDAPYAILVAACTCMLMAIWVPFFYITDYATEIGIDPSLAFDLIAIMNAGSLFGRLVPNVTAEYVGGMTVIIPCAILSAILIFLTRIVSTLPGFIVMSAAYGFISGGMISLPPAVIANLTKNSKELGVRMGLAYSIMAFGALVGNPIGGATLQGKVSDGSVESVQERYQGLWFFAGSIALLCAVLFGLSWFTHLRKEKRAKASDQGEA